MGLDVAHQIVCRGMVLLVCCLMPWAGIQAQNQTGAITLEQVPTSVKNAALAAKSGVLLKDAVRYVKGDQYHYILYGVLFGTEIRVVVSADGIVRQVIEKNR